MKNSVLNMTSIFSSLGLRRKGSSETVVSDSNSTVEKITDNVDPKSSEWHFQRKFLVALLRHLKFYDKALDLDYSHETTESNSKDTINYLRSKIELSPDIYQIDDWNNAVSNRQKIINLQALFSEKSTDNSSRCQALNITITTSCWKQMNGTLQIAESIPEIGETWLAPILVLLSKFPFFEASAKNITNNHVDAVKWREKTSISITKDLDPLRGNILYDSIIPICDKLGIFSWILRCRFDCGDDIYEEYKESRDLLYKDLNNEIFIDDDRWNSHIQKFILESWKTHSRPGYGLSFY